MIYGLLILFGAFGCGGGGYDDYFNEPDPVDELDAPPERRRLVVDLQDGFSADTVRIELDGQLVWEGEDLTTALLTGLAASIEAHVDLGTATLSVSVLTQSAFAEIDLEIMADTYVGISVVEGEIEFYVSDSPFGYG